MPAISATLYPSPAYVRVEGSWGDQPQATGAAVYRVDCLTGERVPLRPYVSFSGDFLDLSCGYGIWWDTEPQLDRCVYYCTQAMNPDGSVITVPAANIVTDTFTRVVANDWGSADTGQPYTNVGGAAADHSVNGTRGVHSMPLVSTATANLLDIGTSDQVGMITGFVGVLPTTGNVEAGIQARYTDTANQWRVDVTINSSGVVTGRLRRVVGGVITNLQTAVLATTHVAGNGYTFWISTWGNLIQASVWPIGSPMPATAMFSTVDSPATVPNGTLGGPLSFLSGAYTGTLPGVVTYDDFTVVRPCGPTEVLEECTPSLVVPSSGDFRLGDPVRPCRDQVLLFDAPIDPDCVPTQGIFFGNMADESMAANTNTFTPVNAKYPIVVSRTRASIASTLTVASKTFADRDAMRLLNDPGSPLLLRGPAAYGIADRYMSVAEVQEVRPLPDHRIQPRVISLPHVAVARPSGPSTGVCGTRVEDLCDIYPTWDAMAAAGLSWADLLRGAASNDTPLPASAERDWAEVLSDFTDWAGVNNNNTDWGDVLDGDA